MGYARYVGRVGALAVALGVGAAVATMPGVAWAEDTGEDTASVDSAPTNPEPGPEPENEGNDEGGDPGDPGAGTGTTTTTTTGTQTTAVIGGGGSPQVTISGSTVTSSGTTSEQTPESSAPTTAAAATPTATVETTSVPEPPIYTPPELPASTVPEPLPSSVPQPDPPPSTAPEGDPQELNAGEGDPQELMAGEGDPSGTTLMTTLDGADPGTEQFGLRMAGPTGIDEPQNVMAADFSAAFTTLDAPPPPPPAPDPVEAILVFVGSIITQVMDAVSAALAPIFGPGAPFYNSVIWGAIEAVRRQTYQSWANTTPVVDLQTTGQQDPDDREIHGTLGGSDPDGDPLTYSVPTSGAGAPTNGTVSIDAAAGTWTYKPNTGYSGTDTFTITASDAAAGFHVHGAGQTHTASDSITVTVTPVTPTNNPPVAGDPAFVVDSVDQLTGVVTGHVVRHRS